MVQSYDSNTVMVKAIIFVLRYSMAIFFLIDLIFNQTYIFINYIKSLFEW